MTPEEEAIYEQMLAAIAEDTTLTVDELRGLADPSLSQDDRALIFASYQAQGRCASRSGWQRFKDTLAEIQSVAGPILAIGQVVQMALAMGL